MNRALDVQEKIDTNNKERTPSALVYSALLGVPFVGSWLGFTATVAEDGREPVTEWLDPMLAGLTLVAILVAQLVLMYLWPRLSDSRFRIYPIDQSQAGAPPCIPGNPLYNLFHGPCP